MASIKNKLKHATISGTMIVSMLLGNGCATTDEQPEQEAKIILSKDIEGNKNLTNSDRVCLQSALKKVRDKETEKSNPNEKSCFDACGGAFIKKGKECKYIPSKYEFKNNSCFCNGQDIAPYKQREQTELEMQACQQICKSAATSTTIYEADLDKTQTFRKCICKIVEQNNQK